MDGADQVESTPPEEETMEVTDDQTPVPPSASHVQEISQENIKNRINEVITEIEREVEHELEEDSGSAPAPAPQEPEPEEKGSTDDSAADLSSESQSASADVVISQSESGDAVTKQPEPADGEVDQLEHAEVKNNQSDSVDVVTNQSEPAHAAADVVTDQSESADVAKDQSKSADDITDLSEGNEITCDQIKPTVAALSESKPASQPHPENQSVNWNTAPIENGEKEDIVPSSHANDPSELETRNQDMNAQQNVHAARFTSPFQSTSTSSLPRGWKTGGAMFAVSALPPDPAPPQTQQQNLQTGAYSVCYPPVQTSNAMPRFWHASLRAEPAKRVHFAAEPQVQTFDENPEAAQVGAVQMRPKVGETRKPRPVSAPSQLGAVSNMAARPFGRTDPFIVAPVGRTSPLPLTGEDAKVEVQVSAPDDLDRSNLGNEMSEEVAPAPAPVAPPPESTTVPAKIFTPANDEPITAPKKKTMFVDSAFFSPKVHPTWEQQVQLAKKISASLSDASNKQSRGQNMYERRKKRSVKWVHQAGGFQSETEESCDSSQTPKNKPLLQLVMNPHGHVYDLKALTKQGWAIDSKGGLSPEICHDLIRDLNAPTGKGAQIFAKRKKKAEKWVVDETHREHRRPEDPAPVPQAPRASQAGQLPRVNLKPTPPAPAVMPPKPSTVQLPPVQLKPVPLQSLCNPVRQPQHPVGGVYAPRTAHGWSSAPPTAPPPAMPAIPAVPAVPIPAVPAAEVQMRHPPVSHHEDEFDTGVSRADKLQNRQSWANYNTAPRGWGNTDAFYRPVTFTQALMSQ